MTLNAEATYTYLLYAASSTMVGSYLSISLRLVLSFASSTMVGSYLSISLRLVLSFPQINLPHGNKINKKNSHNVQSFKLVIYTPVITLLITDKAFVAHFHPNKNRVYFREISPHYNVPVKT